MSFQWWYVNIVFYFHFIQHVLITIQGGLFSYDTSYLCFMFWKFSVLFIWLFIKNSKYFLELSPIYLLNQFYWLLLLFSFLMVFLLGWKWPFLTVTLIPNPLCSFTPLWVWYLSSSQSAFPHLSPTLLGYQLPLPTAKSINVNVVIAQPRPHV